MLITLIMVISWVFVLLPLIIFLSVSIVTLKALTQEDPYILGVTLISLTLFCLGFVTLLLLYLTNVFAFLSV
ncbi:hypothetical protein A2239_00455 [Candidatus Uhrbacteria bacterium RIFOXYA2_FULL_40_9]|nr:MAG: hypothetical protein A2239_00455 [Candidatus Uhrbacteria bacterium RIFOXYA2_FULL_40_9]OGL96755.1 MAG: hypothetical protein A2332_04430 [Candidatus Uhrbacteria bacterium RIFOXYB2_FULL_41_18]HBK34471.1 hypothetical protein [Candidatus Uhrbacteria bacterium]HCB55557.1 hypothetical protein [Candidatus Uhrbacteria bacterium]